MKTSPKPSRLSIENRITPRFCRFVARENRRGMTNARIAKLSGLTRSQVVWISTRDVWNDITIGQKCAFMDACGVLPHNQWQHVAYFKRTVKQSKRPFGKLWTYTSSRFRRSLLGLPTAGRKPRAGAHDRPKVTASTSASGASK